MKHEYILLFNDGHWYGADNMDSIKNMASYILEKSKGYGDSTDALLFIGGVGVPDVTKLNDILINID